MDDVFELSPEVVKRFQGCYWWMPAAQRAGQGHANAQTPGMDFNHVVACLEAVGAIVRNKKSFNNRAVATGLVRVVLSRSGAARAYFENGEVKESGQLEPDPYWVYRLD